MYENNVLTSDNAPEDENLDIELRPKRFCDFIDKNQ